MIGRLFQWARDRVNGKKPEVSRVMVLSALPVRNPGVEWERVAKKTDEDDDAGEGGDGAAETLVLIRVPRRNDKLGNVAAKIFRLPDFRKLELDEIGSDVWEACDGNHTVEDLTGLLVRKYRLNRRQAETSVTAYLRLLAQRRLIALKTGQAGKAERRGGKPAPRNAPRKPKRA
jgi:hypothetical protein